MSGISIWPAGAINSVFQRILQRVCASPCIHGRVHNGSVR